MSAPRSSATLTEPMPSAAVERTRRTPSRPRTRSSMRLQTASSTSAGVAPK